MALKDLAFSVSLNPRKFNHGIAGVHKELNKLAKTRMDGITREMGKMIKEGKTLKDTKFKKLVGEFKDLDKVVKMTERTSKRARKSIQKSFSNMNINWRSALRISMATVAIQGLVHMAAGVGKSIARQIRESFAANMTKADTERMFGAIMGNAGVGKAVSDKLREYALARSLDINEVVAAGRSLLTSSGNDPQKMMKMLKIAERLAILNPDTGMGGGFSGASIALKEAEADDYVSLRERFNVSRSDLNQLKSQGLRGAELVDAMLKMKGITDAAAAEQTRTARAWMTSISNFVSEIRRALGEGIFARINQMGSSVQEWIQGSGQKLLDMATGIGMMMADGFGKAVQWAKSLVPIIMPAVDKLAAIVSYLFQSGKAQSFIVGIADTIVRTVEYLVALFQSIDLKKIGQSVLNIAKEVGSLLFDILVHAGEVIGSKIRQSLPGILGGGISTQQDQLNQAWQQYGPMSKAAQQYKLDQLLAEAAKFPAQYRHISKPGMQAAALQKVMGGQRIIGNPTTMGSIWAAHSANLTKMVPQNYGLPALPNNAPLQNLFATAQTQGNAVRLQQMGSNYANMLVYGQGNRQTAAAPGVNPKLAAIQAKNNAAVAKGQRGNMNMNLTVTSYNAPISPVQGTIAI